MEITKEQNGNELTLKIVGRLETASAPLLDAEIRSLAADVTALVLDFGELEYVSSAGLRVILTAQKTMNARKAQMKLVGVNPTVRRVFDITGFSPVLTIV